MAEPVERTKKELGKLGIGNAKEYIDNLYYVMMGASVTQISPINPVTKRISLNDGFNEVIYILGRHDVLLSEKRLMIIGNGGSASIATHMLMDYLNAGNIKTADLTNSSLLTCMANDNGWENVFSTPIHKMANNGDVLFAISSSGQSKNILNACDAAKEKGCTVITFSGMNIDNPLRYKGYLNFYVPSFHYGFVELTHEAILHGILDLFIKNRR